MKKINLVNIKNSLSRAEMKKIMAGSGSGGNKCCPNGYSTGSNGSVIVCSDCGPGTYCSQGHLVAC